MMQTSDYRFTIDIQDSRLFDEARILKTATTIIAVNILEIK